MNYRLAQINLTPGKNAQTVSEVFVAQPDSYKEILAGKLFILIEIDNAQPGCLKILNFLTDKLNFNYYQNEKIILKERLPSLKTEHIFETALAKTNKDFEKFIQNEKIKLNAKFINVIVGIVHKDTLYFSNQGKNKILLIHRTKTKFDKKEEQTSPIYKITDISGQINKEEKKQNKFFSNVISGHIPQKSFFLIANEALPEYISNKQLTEIISTLPPLSAVEQIKNLLLKINSYVSFLGIIIKKTTIDNNTDARPSQASPAQNSISNLKKTEESTENLLNPSNIIDTGKWFKFIKNIFSKKTKNTNSINASLKDKIYVKRKTFNLFQKSFKLLKNILYYIINFFYFIFKNLSSKEKLQTSIKSLSIKLTNIFITFKNKIINLDKKSKIFLILFIVSFIVLAINITKINNKKQLEKANSNYAALVSDIEKKQNQAEANLLYSNENGAQKLFDEIKNLLNQLPQDNEEQKKIYTKFKNYYDTQMEKIRKIEKIDTPVELANFSNLNSAASPDNIIFIASAKKLYAADSEQKSIYRLEIPSNLATIITDLSGAIDALLTPVLMNNNIYYQNQKQILKLSAENNNLSNLPINLITSPENIIAAGSYGDRLYLLDKKNNQIYRYNLNAGSFSSPYAWVQTKTDFSNTIGMAIDGHIYVLEKNGKISRFLRGQIDDFNLEKIDPPLENASKIKTSKNNKFIYILEPQKKRLVLFDKTGQFVLQYKFESLDKLIDFWIDENTKTIYLLNNTSIFAFTATHFEE